MIAEDDWLNALFSTELSTIADYARCTAKLRHAIGPHVVSLLQAGIPVVLDFQANTLEARNWMRGLIAQSNARHQLHVLDVPDDICLQRLRARNAQGDHPFAVTEEQFALVTRHYLVPTPDEGFTIIRHSVAD